MANVLDGVTEDQRDDPKEGLGRIMIYRDPTPQGDNLVPANGNKLTQAVAPEPQGDLASNIAKLRELVANFGTGILDQLGVAGMQPGPQREAAVTGRNAMLGIGDEQNLPWPQRMIRSGATLPGDVASGEQPVVDPFTGRTSGRLIERTQDLAGLAGGGALTERPGVATLGSGPTRSNIGNVAMKPTEPAPVFYSALEHAVENSAQKTATPEQWAGFLKNTPGVKAEEIQWTGIGDWLAQQKGKVSKDDVKAYLDEHKVELKDVTKGDDLEAAIKEHIDNYWADEGREPTHAEREAKNREIAEDIRANPDEYELGADMDTKYSEYQLPGGENYREHLLTLPERPEAIVAKARLNDPNRDLRSSEFDSLSAQAQPYESSHWDEPNVLAHVRTNDRDVGGKKSLHIEEIQSDWHQQGRKQGYQYKDAQKQYDQLETKKDRTPAEEQRLDELTEHLMTRSKAVPDAPFKTTWPELALKRMIRHAAENGYDRISWTPGEAQAARYDLSKHYQDIRAYKKSDGKIDVWGRPAGVAGPRNAQHIAKDVSPEKLSDIVGKELADKIANQQPEYEKTYSGVDLKVGGEGMREFYDKMLPKMAEKIGKAHGVKVKHSQPAKFTVEPEGNHFKIYADGKDSGYGGFMTKEGAMEEIAQLTKDQPGVHYFDLPQSLREHAVGRGFPLYMTGLPFPLKPVDYDPFKKKDK